MATSRGVLGVMLVLALALIASVLWLQGRGGGDGADSSVHALPDAPRAAPTSRSSESKLERSSDDDPVPRAPISEAPSTDASSREGAEDDDEPQSEEAKSKAEPTGVLVRVVDERDRAVGGVRVGIVATHKEALAPATFVEGTTDPDTGLVRLEDRKFRNGIPPGVTLRVAVLLPLEVPVESAIDHFPVEGEIRLIVPISARAWLEPIRVQVVGPSGEPVVRAVVVFRATRPDDPGSSPNNLGASATTAPDGIASIYRDKGVTALLEARQLGMRTEFEVGVHGPYVDAPRAKIDMSRPDTEPVRLVLPETARVEVEVRGASGELVETGAEVGLEWRAPNSGGTIGFFARATVTADAPHGVAVFDRVGLGLELRLGAWLKDNSVERVYAEHPGPTRAHEVLRYVLKLGARRPMLAGRIVDGAGAPVPGFLFFFHSNPGGTDASGRFKIDLGGAVRNLAATDAELAERPSPTAGAPPGWIPRYARFELPARVAGGETLELGDLVLHDVPILVAGVVVDARGKPVDSAWMTFRYQQTPGEQSDWYNLNIGGPRRSTDADGRFELRHLQKLSELRVGAHRNDIGVAEEITVPAGSTGLRLVLQPIEKQPVGRILGSLLLDEGIPSNLLSAYYEHESGASRDGEVINGKFALQNVPPGVSAVEIRTMDTKWLVERIEGVHVDADEKSADPRLDGIDLRGRLRVLKLRFVDEERLPYAHDAVQISIAGEGHTLKTDEQGRFVALTRSSDGSFDLWADGFERTKVSYAPEEQEIVLVRKAR